MFLLHSNTFRQIESQVTEISQIQRIIATTVSHQSTQIDQVLITTEMASTNVKAGTKELNKAIKQSVDLRVCVLLFIIVCSFALLFLHWIKN